MLVVVVFLYFVLPFRNGRWKRNPAYANINYLFTARTKSQMFSTIVCILFPIALFVATAELAKVAQHIGKANDDGLDAAFFAAGGAFRHVGGPRPTARPAHNNSDNPFRNSSSCFDTNLTCDQVRTIKGVFTFEGVVLSLWGVCLIFLFPELLKSVDEELEDALKDRYIGTGLEHDTKEPAKAVRELQEKAMEIAATRVDRAGETCRAHKHADLELALF